MYQKDYLLRMIEMLGDLLRAIFGMITRGDLNIADEKLNEAYYTMLRKDAWFFQHIPLNELTKTLIEDHNYTNDHLQILAELFYAEAVLKYANNNYADSLLYYRKSLALFEFTDQAYRTYSEDRLERMALIREKISELSMTCK
jgi:hypothetical protein